MVERYEAFSVAISGIYKYIQKIERHVMSLYGLKGPHAQCLTTLLRFPQGLTSSQLGEFCDKDKAAISRAISELEQKGLILRNCVNNNSYKALLLLTDDGRKAAEEITKTATEAVEAAGNGLTDDDRSVFYRTLYLIAENIEKFSRKGVEKHESN